MSPETKRVFDILAKYKVSLPVAAYIELGILPAWDQDVPPEKVSRFQRQYNPRGYVDRQAPAGAPLITGLTPMSHTEMMHIAMRKGRVRWFASGIVERLGCPDSRTYIFASGKHTSLHILRERTWYNCLVVGATGKLDLPVNLSGVSLYLLRPEFRSLFGGANV